MTDGVGEGDANMIITWSDILSIGHDTIDREHKYILDTVTRLYLIEVDNKSKDESVMLFGEMIDLIVSHFHNEEAVMRINRYPNTDHHIELHSELFSRLTDILYLLETGSDRVAHELVQCIDDWAHLHILVQDRMIVDYLEANHL